MGQAIARRLGPGSQLVLADIDRAALDALARQLTEEGYDVTPIAVDVSSRESVTELAKRAAALGPVQRVVHTAGLSPVQASVAQILAVDLLGVALVTEIFAEVIAPGGAGVVIASMAGYHYRPLTPEESGRLATTPADELLSIPMAAQTAIPSSAEAYMFAKRANHLRIQAASVSWGARGARINSISPGIIATAQGNAELNGEFGPIMQAMIDGSNAQRVGTSTDVAAAVEFLLSPAAGFISGTDLLVDGGVTAASSPRAI
jgi:NAD(P)-dependent dehydrogenase (short-subunit alcohol dehydrogenase family)